MATYSKDSSNKPIKVGDTVAFREKEYTIKEFKPGEGRYGSSAIVFEEEQHIDEVADEMSVDFVKGKCAGSRSS